MPISESAKTSQATHCPLVSVVMSVYNGEPYVRAAVESILNQTFRDLELIVVDDGSTDTTPQTLTAISDPRLRVIRQPNRGQPAGLNAGLRLARAELITFMDADDISEPRRIERQAGFLMAHPEFGGVGAWEIITDAKDRELDREQKPLEHEEIVRAYDSGGTGLNAMLTMVRAAVFREVGTFREQLPLANDVDMWMRATERFRFACLPEYLYHYRQHPGASCTARKQAIAFYRQLVNELRAERLAGGTDRLARGEPIHVPDFQEEPGTSSYDQAVSWYHRHRSRRCLEQGRWGQALRWAISSWWYQPISQPANRHLAKTVLWPVLRRVRSARPRSHASANASGGADDEGLHCTLVQDIETLTELADQWDALVSGSETPTSFFLTSMSLLPFWTWHGRGRRLAVVLVRDNEGRLVGAAPFYRERVGRRLSRHWRFAFLGSPESGADYLDILARPGCREAVWRQTFKCLADHGICWDAMNLNYILDNSPTLGLLRPDGGGPRFRVYQEPSSVCPFVALRPSWEEFRATLGGSTRRGLSYKWNLMRRRFKKVWFENITDEARVPEVIRQMLEYKQIKYGHQFDYDYASWPDQAIAALRRGCLRLYVLWFDDNAACFWFTFVFNRRVFFQACSYSPEYASLSPGNIMLGHVIREAIAEGVVEYDMKRGETEYKFHWANGQRQTVQVNAVRRGLRGAWIGFWEYSPTMAHMRQWARRVYRKLRRATRYMLQPVASCCPGALPARLRERILRPTDRMPAPGAQPKPESSLQTSAQGDLVNMPTSAASG